VDIPGDFRLGASSAAYQIEGGWDADGKGESIWDRFCHSPGRIRGGDTGDVACDHYGRYKEDVDLLQGAGLDAYRFSVAWSRVLPDGVGAVNEAGLGFYDRLVDALLARGVEPWACLYHWDLPQALQERGGWTNRDVAGWLADYAGVVARRLGDRVKRWVPLNEPNTHAVLGHAVRDRPAHLCPRDHLRKAGPPGRNPGRPSGRCGRAGCNSVPSPACAPHRARPTWKS